MRKKIGHPKVVQDALLSQDCCLVLNDRLLTVKNLRDVKHEEYVVTIVNE